MKIYINNHRKRNSLLLIGIVIVFTALAAGLELTGVTDFIHTNKPTDEANQKQEKQTSLDNKKDFIEKDASRESPKRTTDQVPINQELSASITQLEQTSAGVIFSARIDNSSRAGLCSITFSNPNDKPVVKEVDASLKDGVAACGPLSISPLEFSYLGEWQVILRYYLDDEQAIANGKVVIR